MNGVVFDFYRDFYMLLSTIFPNIFQSQGSLFKDLYLNFKTNPDLISKPLSQTQK